MFTSAVEQLEVLTRSYWFLSQILAGRSKEHLTVEKAIKSVNTIEFNLGPQRPLLRITKALGDALVEGKIKKVKKPATISMLPSRSCVITGGTNA